MLYLTVLGLEFSPVVLEHPWFDRRPLFHAAHRVLKRATIPLVIAGIMLSTLHQSSLGSLFLITPFRLHALWYSPIIWVLFLVSAVGVGLLMVTLESYVSAWLFGHELPREKLASLGRAASVTLLLYAALRLGDLAWRGGLGLAIEPSGAAALFWLEMALSALVPGVLLAVPAVRRHAGALGLTAFVGVLGIIGYRFNVAIVAFSRPGGASYFPTWMEVAVSAGIVAGALLVFIFFVEHLRVYGDAHGPAERVERPDPVRSWSLLPPSLAFPRNATLAFVAGAAVALALLPAGARTGSMLAAAPASPARAVEGTITAHAVVPGHDLTVTTDVAAGPLAPPRAWLMVIDGNRDSRQVVFPHDLHETALGGKASCASCHHAVLPFSRQSACAECHRDMYSPTDTFDHQSHVARLGGDAGCARCHPDTGLAKTRASATPCRTCHVTMQVAGSRVRPERQDGIAASYLDAMHGLCIDCHEERMKLEPALHPSEFARCRNCHRDAVDETIRRLAPYAAPPDGVATVQARGQ